MKTLNGYLVVLAVDKDEEAKKEFEKKTGFVIPERAQLAVERAIAEGEVLYSDDTFKKGDLIIFSSFATLDFDYQGKTVYAIQAKDVIAIL